MPRNAGASSHIRAHSSAPCLHRPIANRASDSPNPQATESHARKHRPSRRRCTTAFALRTHLLPDSRTRHAHALRAYTAHTSTRVSDTTTHPTARGRKYAAQLHICIHMRSFHCIVRVEQTRSVGVPATTMPTSGIESRYTFSICQHSVSPVNRTSRTTVGLCAQTLLTRLGLHVRFI